MNTHATKPQIANTLMWALISLAVASCSRADPSAVNEESIIGGSPTTIEVTPWLVSIRAGRSDYDGSSHRCSGAILSERWILTTARCLHSPLPSRRDYFSRLNYWRAHYLWVAAGVTRQDTESGTRGQRREIESYIIHEDYDEIKIQPGVGSRRSRGQYDIALLRLSSPLDLSQPGVAAIDRLTSEQEVLLAAPGRLATLAGWGYTEKGGRGSRTDELLQLVVPIVSNELAMKLYPKERQISDLQLAAGDLTGEKSICGDRGSPLVAWDPFAGRQKLLGLASWGGGCGEPDSPGMYVRVSAYQDWIDQHMVEEPKAKGWFQFTSLTDEQFVEGQVNIEAEATDGRVLSRVEFKLPGGTMTDRIPPYRVTWDSTSLLAGKYALAAKAFDEYGMEVASISIPVHVINTEEQPNTFLITNFESYAMSEWWRTATGNPHDNWKVAPFRGHRALIARASLFDGDFHNTISEHHTSDVGRSNGPFRRILTHMKQLRMWAKNGGTVDMELSLILNELDGEEWQSKHRARLSDDYEVVRFELDQDAFELINEGSPDSADGDRQLSLRHVQIKLHFSGIDATLDDELVIHVDDIVADALQEVPSIGNTLFDFVGDQEEWTTFGGGVPDLFSGFGTLSYTNAGPKALGGFTRSMGDTLTLLAGDTLVLRGRCDRPALITFGFSENGGEQWSGPEMPFEDFASVSLRPEHFTSSNAPISGRPDFDQVKAVSFLVRDVDDDFDTTQSDVRCSLQHVFTQRNDITVYEDAEDKLSRRWHIYDNRSEAAQFVNRFDHDRNSRVIELLPGDGNPVQDGFALETEDGLWNNSDQRILQWSMQFDSRFMIYVDVETTIGQKYIYYTRAATNVRNPNPRYIHVGLGAVHDGQWHTITRNLQDDLRVDPTQNADAKILSVNRFLVRGRGRLDDIRMLDEN